jgi:hypothetical protein
MCDRQQTVEQGVGDQTTWIDGNIADGTEWIAVAVVEVTGTDKFSSELV